MCEFYKPEPEDGTSLEDEGSCFNALELYVDERRKEEMAGAFRLDQPLQAAAHDTGWQYGTYVSMGILNAILLKVNNSTLEAKNTP